LCFLIYHSRITQNITFINIINALISITISITIGGKSALNSQEVSRKKQEAIRGDKRVISTSEAVFLGKMK